MNKGYTINAGCFRYIVPFRYMDSFAIASHKIEDQTIERGFHKEQMPLWNRRIEGQENAESDLYSYVREEFQFDSESGELADSRVGCEWIYWNSAESKTKDGKKIKKLVYSKDHQDNLELSITNLGLFLFRNGVGFIWYEIEMPMNIDSNQLKEIQNHIRELNKRKDPVLWEQVLENKLTQDMETPVFYKGNKKGYRTFLVPFSFGKWINDILSFLRITYFAERKSVSDQYSYAPDKAILFSYVSFDSSAENENMNDQYELSYHLTSGYTDAYHFSEETRQVMQCPFDHVVWNATQEGVSYLAWPDRENFGFFRDTLPGKIRRDYFTLFIKVLYQSFSLLLYAEKIQKEISCVFGDSMDEKSGSRVTALCGEINLFLTKSMAASVSHIHHQSEFYIFLKKQFRVDENVKSVTAGLNALENLLRQQREREENVRLQNEWKEEQKRDSQTQAIMGLFALLGITSALTDGVDFVTKIVKAETWSQLSSGSIIAVRIIIGIIAVVGCCAFYFAARAVLVTFFGKKPDDGTKDLKCEDE